MYYLGFCDFKIVYGFVEIYEDLFRGSVYRGVVYRVFLDVVVMSYMFLVAFGIVIYLVGFFFGVFSSYFNF